MTEGRLEVRSGYWFRPKRLGYGAVPATWQGWLATLVFVAGAGLIAHLGVHRDRAWMVLLVPLTLAFIWLAAIKTDGDWRLRWGGEL